MIQRPDDREEVISERLQAYDKQTRAAGGLLPAAGLLDDGGCDGQTSEEVQQELGEDSWSARNDAQMIICNSQAELEKMHRAGLVVQEVLERAARAW